MYMYIFKTKQISFVAFISFRVSTHQDKTLPHDKSPLIHPYLITMLYYIEGRHD